jgi:antitoxin component of MazEF toxin-antitoxin module
MEIRRVLKFNGTLGMTLPNKFTSIIGLHWQDYVEIYLADDETIVVRKHKVSKSLKGEYGKYESSATATA